MKYHSSVLLKEAIAALKVTPNKWYLDATLGDGGHSLEILKKGGNVLGVDVDPQALERAKGRINELGCGDKFKAVYGNFREIDNLIKQTDLAGQKFKGVIFDLGVSSLQLEDPARGFSFGKEGPLDMRMDPSLQVKALDLIKVLKKEELYELFNKFGEEKFARGFAEAVARAREVRSIQTTRDLAEVIEKVGPKGKIHPATRVFQALRIAVNDELNAFSEALEKVKEKIEKNGRILVISFHSLEDRIAKTSFREWEKEGVGRILTKKPVLPSEHEILANPRSRSAKMRIFETI